MLSARISAAVALAAFGGAVLAMSAPASAQDQRTYATIVLNGVSGAQSLVLVRNGDIFIDASTLDALNIPHAGAPDCNLKGVTYVSLRALAPGVTYTFDSQSIELALTLKPSLLPANSVSLAPSRPAGSRTAVRAVTVNYDVAAAQGQALGGSAVVRYAAGDQHLYESTFGKSIFGGIVRGLSDVTVDDPSHLRSTVVGDVLTRSSFFSGNAIIGGIAFRRAFDLDPYAIHFPVPRLTTTVTSPTVAQVYVNGALVDTLQLQPGNYTLSDLPARVGYTNAQIVLVDTFGNSLRQDASFASSGALLRKGLADYEFAAGALRHDAGGSGDGYGSTAMSGMYRLGVSSALTLGAHGEQSALARDGGIEGAAIVGDTVVIADVDRSREGALPGSAAQVTLGEQGLRSSWSVSASAQTAHFATLVQRAAFDRPLFAMTLDAAQAVARAGSIGEQVSYTRDRDAGGTARAGVTLTQSIRGVSVAVTGSLATTFSGSAQRLSPGFAIMLSRSVGRLNFDASSTHDASGTQTTVSISSINNSHFGATAAVTADASTMRPQVAQYGLALQQGSADVLLARNGNGGYVPSGSLSGAVTFAAHDVFFTQGVDDASVVVVTPGLAHVPVDMDGLIVAYTDRHGKALVPFGRSNEPNDIAVAEQALPENAQLKRATLAVVPSRRGVASATFEVERIHSVTGFILSPGNAYSGGTVHLRVGGEMLDAPLDENARFYIGDIAPGTYEGTATAGERTCSLVLHVPDFTGLRLSLGPVSCAQQ